MLLNDASIMIEKWYWEINIPTKNTGKWSYANQKDNVTFGDAVGWVKQ